MNYELAKELKDAGFPQVWPINTPEGTAPEPYEGPYYFPTLDELIKACGKDFASLEYFTDDTEEWWAYGRMLGHEGSFAPTPEEAVAMLWLALNKKPL